MRVAGTAEQVARFGDIRQHGVACRLEEGGHGGFEEQQREHQPDHGAGSHQQHSQYYGGPRQVCRDHDVLAPQPVVHHARGGRHQGLRQYLQDQSREDAWERMVGQLRGLFK